MAMPVAGTPCSLLKPEMRRLKCRFSPVVWEMERGVFQASDASTNKPADGEWFQPRIGKQHFPKLNLQGFNSPANDGSWGSDGFRTQ